MAVDLEKKGHVGVITMNRPEALNALNTPMLQELEKVIDQVEADDEIYVCVLTGAGRSFVAGADIGEMSAFGAVEIRRLRQQRVPEDREYEQAHHRCDQWFCSGRRL